MNDIESRLRDAMAARAAEVEPDNESDALTRITRRVNVNRRRSYVIMGVAAAVLVAVGAIALLRRDDDKPAQQVTANNPSASSSTSTSTSSSAPPISVVPKTDVVAIWPFQSSGSVFATQQDAAKSFAVDYLGMTNARIGEVLPPADANGAFGVEVFPNDRGSARTVVSVVELPDAGWVVIGANADHIVVDTPKPHDPLTEPLPLAGQSLAFEGQLGVELRPFGSKTPIATSSVIGGGTEVLPFSGSIEPPAGDQPLVLVLFEGDASGEQTYTQATVIPLDPAVDPPPADYVALSTADELVHLDFAGHVQQPLASQVAVAVFARQAGLVAYSPLGETCTTRFVSLSGGAVPAEFPGTPVAISGDGSAMTYQKCDSPPPVYVVRNLTNDTDTTATSNYPPPLPAGVVDPAATVRGRFLTTAFFDGTSIASYNPTTGAVVKLVTPAAKPVSLDADASGRFLMWVDENTDLWTWDGGEPAKVGSGFKSAAW